MAARPPQQDDDAGEMIEFGIAALAAELDAVEVSYPVEGGELVRVLGDPAIPIDAHGQQVALSTIIEHVPRQEFGSEQAVLNALHPVFETYREEASRGLLASVRALLPF